LALKIRISFGFALPDDNYLQAYFLKSIDVPAVAFDVPLELGEPKALPSFWAMWLGHIPNGSAKNIHARQ
jgi:hypothetical protein